MTKITITELTAETVELLPSRDTLFFNTYSSTNLAAVYAQNSSLALNAGSLWSSANSIAAQSIAVVQN